MRSITSIPTLLPRNTKSNRSSFRSTGGSRTEKERKSEKLSLVCVLKRQFCGCFQPKLESEKETEDSRAFDNLSPITKKRPLDYKVLKQTQVFSGKQLKRNSGLAMGNSVADFESSPGWRALRSDKKFQ